MNDVRPLRWHDLPLAYRLAGHGVSFDTRLRLTVGDDPLRQALLTSLGRTTIYVLRKGDGGALGQLHYPAKHTSARLAYVAPDLEEGDDDTLWLTLLDGLARVAGERGSVNLIAEVDDDSPMLDVLRRANFGVYARQELWAHPTSPAAQPGNALLRPAADMDEPGMQTLYSELMPGLMRQVEPLAVDTDAAYVMDDGETGRIMVMVLEHRGIRKTLIEIYMHPDVAELAYAVVNNALSLVHSDDQPVYCRLRSRLAPLGAALLEAGFEPVTTQAVMVRHTAARIRHHAFGKLPVVEGVFPATNRISDAGKWS